jgi:uncharacterized repeat protein (TIGR01451 family)
MKHYEINRLRVASSLAVGFTIALYPASASASGVTAGTLIQNTATATYTSGSDSGTVNSNTVTVRVDELLNVAVTGLDGAPITIGAGTAVLSYSITNTGNGSEAFDITVGPTVAGNDFDATVQSVAIDTNGNGTYEPGVDQVLATGAATPAIAPDASLTLFVIVALPTGVNDGDTSQVRLTADAVTGTGSAGTVFAGQGEGGGDAVVGSSGATGNGLESLLAALANVALTKSAVVDADPVFGTQPVPGAVITYTLSAQVSGAGQVDSLRITDVIPAGTTYQNGTLTLDAAALTDGADADAGTASAAGIDVNLGTVAGGTTKTVTFKVRIN